MVISLSSASKEARALWMRQMLYHSTGSHLILGRGIVGKSLALCFNPEQVPSDRNTMQATHVILRFRIVKKFGFLLIVI